MRLKRLGNSDIRISPVGVGTWAIGGDNWTGGWGPQNTSEALAALECAVRAGINWIDTAAVYGLGQSERLVGQLLRRLSPAERPLVFTKGSLTWNSHSELVHRLDPLSIAAEVEASLKRLGVDCIDLYQIHFGSYPPGAPDNQLEAALQKLNDLRQAGKIREIGVSNFTIAQLSRAISVAPILSVQPPYSLINRSVEFDILPFCRRHGLGVIVYSPLESGLLSGRMTRQRIQELPDGDWRKTGAEEFQEPNLTRNLAQVERLRLVASRHGVSSTTAALAWVQRNPDVTGTIAGVRRPEHIEGILRSADFDLTEDDIATLGPAPASLAYPCP